MNKEKGRVPKLRFPGFTEDWEQCKLNEFLSVSDLKNTEDKYNKKDVLSVSGDYGIVNQIEFQGRSFAGVSVSNYGVVETGDIVYTKSPLKLNPYGIIKTNRINNGIVSTLYAIYKTKENCDSKFIEHYFNLDSRLNKYLKPLVNKGAKNDMKVSSENALIGEVCFPHITEQKLIADFLDWLDVYITLHQRKLEHLNLKKKALLQKLFPKDGERYPELRFPGFTDAWEQRKLNDFGIATGGTSIESEFVDGGTYKVISIGSYSEESVYNDQGLRVNKTDKTKFRILNKDDLTMILNDKTASGNIIGRVLLIDQDNTYVYNQRTERIEVDTKNFLPMFLYHMLNAPEQRKYIVKASQGNTQIYVNWSTINNIDYMIPQLLLEQEKIANLFSLINKDITLHQRKLEHLQLQKKALLQQMFV